LARLLCAIGSSEPTDYRAALGDDVVAQHTCAAAGLRGEAPGGCWARSTRTNTTATRRIAIFELLDEPSRRSPIMRANTTTLLLTSEMMSALQECYDACTTRLGRPLQNMTEMLDVLEGLAPGTPADTEDLRDTIKHLRKFQNHSKMPVVFGELQDSRIRN
jgi:hypothetical protein